MMREILFRGKRIDNGEWATGYYTVWRTVQHVIYTPDKYGKNSRDEVDPDTVGQYTGLKDKNGVKIFEGDIVRLVHDWHDDTYETWDAVVEFGNPNGEYSWGWQLKPITECIFNPDILLWVEMEETGASCEVIGNIHDISEENKDNG